jgi:hypothetical protein
MLKVFKPNGLPYLGERSEETIASRAALGERLLKEKLAIWRREVKVVPEISQSGLRTGATSFVKGL